jgi:hypothetical protein
MVGSKGLRKATWLLALDHLTYKENSAKINGPRYLENFRPCFVNGT